MKIEIEWGGGPVIAGPVLLGLDVEGKKRNCRLVQIAQDEKAWLYDMASPIHFALVQKLITDERVHFVSHSRYDVDALWYKFGVDISGRARDSFLLACLVYPGEHNPHGLKPLSTKLIDAELEQAEKRLHDRFKELYGGRQQDYLERGYNECNIHDPAYELYSAMDPVYCLKLYHVLKEQVDLHPSRAMRVTADVYFSEQEISDVLGESGQRGMHVDRERAQRLLQEARDGLANANDMVRQLTGYPARSVKVGKWLEERGVDFPERTPAGGPKLDKSALKILVPRYDGTEAGEVLKARQLASANSNRVANLQNFLMYSEEDGAVHPEFKTAIAATGRMSVTNPAMQTLSKGDGETGLRSVFVARPGYVLIGADYDTQELRVAAALSGDNKLANRILEGEDLHNAAAEAIFGPGFTKAQRAIGKVLNFASLYGAGPRAIAKQTGMSYEDAKVALKLWWAGYPDLKAWNEYNMDQAETGPGYVMLDSGRYVPAERDRAYALTNYLVQGTARDITAQAVLAYARLMPGTLLLVVHDEILAEVKEDEVEKGLAALNQAMNVTFLSEVQPTAIPMPFTATAEVLGDRWLKN